MNYKSGAYKSYPMTATASCHSNYNQ